MMIQISVLLMPPMKTTLNINDELLARAKAAAVKEHKSLTRLIEEGLVLRLRRPPAPQRHRAAPKLPVYRGRGGLAPGIDPLRNESLYDAADT